MKQTDQKKMPLNRQIFIYISIFVVVILLFLWIAQTIFLSVFYEQGVRRTMKSCAESALEEDVDFYDIMTEYDMSVVVFDGMGKVIRSSSYFRDNYLESISPFMRANMFKETVENGGEKMTIVQADTPYEGDAAKASAPTRMLYSKIGDNGNMVLVEAMVTPVGGVMGALRVQLIWASILFLLLGALFALMISRNISRPLVRINAAAKQLAAGDYHADFSVSGSREVNELSETLNHAAEELSRVEDLRRELIANVSHDLRTPLTMISAYAEMMRDLPGEQTPENVQVIIDEANRMNALVTDLLDLSRLQAGAHGLSKKTFSITECLKTLLDRYQKLIEQENYDIRFSFDRDVAVYADELKITQAAYNLINNAVNYTGEDKRVDVNQITVGDKVRIEIVDTGAGIRPEEIESVWERYYRASDNRHCREKTGSGIGLSIVKEVMELHGERYGVESSCGQGSKFWFELSVKH